MSNLSKRDSFLILQFPSDRLAYLVLRLFIILNLAAGPVRKYLNPEILILLKEIVYLESKIMLLITE